jgi:hypothetical protein
MIHISMSGVLRLGTRSVGYLWHSDGLGKRWGWTSSQKSCRTRRSGARICDLVRPDAYHVLQAASQRALRRPRPRDAHADEFVRLGAS